MRPARGMSTLYPMVPTLWPILEKSQKILNKKQTLRIGENVSLLNSETKEVNLRFVSSSAPTLRSALHFWKYYQVLKGFKIAEDFLFHVKRNWFFFHLEKGSVQRTGIADGARQGKIASCVPEILNVMTFIRECCLLKKLLLNWQLSSPCHPWQDPNMAARNLWRRLVGKLGSQGQLRGDRL